MYFKKMAIEISSIILLGILCFFSGTFGGVVGIILHEVHTNKKNIVQQTQEVILLPVLNSIYQGGICPSCGKGKLILTKIEYDVTVILTCDTCCFEIIGTTEKLLKKK